MMAVLAIIASLLMSQATARQEVRDSASRVTDTHVTRVRIGHCDVHGRFARCSVRSWAGSRYYCRYVAHVRQRGIEFTVYATRLECWG